ncbi:shootin-1-like [Anneissia japonica]|uniref:shootin-1-like n=1 Tax=Anneissia japonica TaxID=1529436 RepID=UPI0014254C17|nr:shootin-1-like [Anneissia japonica]
MAAAEVQTAFVGNSGPQTAHSGKDELDQLKEIAKQALQEHERLKKKYEESQRIQKRLKDQLVSREQELIRIQSVSEAACDEFAEIKAQLEVEQFCREEAESYATKMVKQNKSIKRKSAAILGVNNWASIEISLDEDDEDGTHENTSEQERLNGLKDELTALRKDLDVASEDKIVLEAELKALKQQLEQERLSNSSLKDALKHRDRSIQQLSRVSTLVVSEFEEISENYERETVLRKKAECFAAKMYQENKVVSEVAKRQSQILMDPTQLTSDDKLLEAMKELEELNAMLGDKNEKQDKKVDIDDKVSTHVESVVPPASADLPPVSDDEPPLNSERPSHVDECPPDADQHPPSVDPCPPDLADLSSGMSADQTTPEVVSVSAEVTPASYDTNANDEHGVVTGKTPVLFKDNHEQKPVEFSGQSEEINYSSVTSGESKPIFVPSEDSKPSFVPSEEPKPASVPSEEPKPASVPSEEPKSASVPSEEPKSASVPSGEPGVTSAASEDSFLIPIPSSKSDVTLSDDIIPPPPEVLQVLVNDSSAESGQGIPAHVSEKESDILPDALIKVRDELNSNEDNGQPKKEYVHTLETKLSIAQEENENLEQQINELQDELKKVKEQLEVASEKLRPPPPPPPPPLPAPVKNPLNLFRKLIKGKNTDDKQGKAANQGKGKKDPLQEKYTATIDEMMKRIKSGKAGLKPVGEDERRAIERGRSSKLSRKNTPTPAMMELNGLLKKTSSNRPPLIKSSSESEATSEFLNIMNQRRKKMEIGESIKENGAKGGTAS